jgi:hypothetical protein
MYVDYINHHYMEHGSFYADYEELYRIDPRDLDAVLEMSSRASDPPVQHNSGPLLIYPNPFRRITNIVSNIGHTGEADIAIYDAAGRMVKDLTPLLGGGRRLAWDGKDSEGQRLAPGAYFCRIRAGDISYSRKVVLLE